MASRSLHRLFTQEKYHKQQKSCVLNLVMANIGLYEGILSAKDKEFSKFLSKDWLVLI